MSYSIAVVGLWHLGEIYSAGLAELGHQIIGLSENEAVVGNLSKNVPPLPEPSLAELLIKNQKAGRLRYATDFTRISGVNVLWFAFDTPVDENDNVDTRIIYETLEKALPHLQNDVLIVMSSQVPAGTSQKIKELIFKKRPELKFDYVYTPENLRLGEAVKCFFEPGRIVVGAESERAFRKMEEIFKELKAGILRMSPASAEMAKHAINAFFATSVSFVNDIADLCEETGADVLDVSRALKSEPRIGPGAFLNAGTGFSGGTLGRDLKSLLALGDSNSVSLPVIESVFLKNQKRKDSLKKRLNKSLGGFKDKTISIFGLTYKPGTRTLRRSFAIEFSKLLQKEGAKMRLHDPQALADEVNYLISAEFFESPYEAARAADAIVLLTPWPEFKNLALLKLKEAAKPGAVFFDATNFFYGREKEFSDAGFRYVGVGRKVSPKQVP